MSVLNKTIILDYLKNHKLEFVNEYAISKIGLFGSFASDSSHENSDIDIVYETSSKGLTLSQLLAFESDLEREFGTTIDLVNLKYMNPMIKRKALKDIVYV